MALALFLLRIETNVLATLTPNDQAATVVRQAEVVTVSGRDEGDLVAGLQMAAQGTQAVQQLVINDVQVGTGATAATGDTVTVHYVGRLQSGVEFDSSYKQGQPFTFTIGEGRVIPGWEEGIVGMAEGGSRILVIPPRLAYGNRVVGPIPANSTLVFAVELLSVEKAS
jgi:FKBP-type peptidyl-prolyl cis-trans isomerase